MEELPEDLMCGVFLKLQLKALIRFRSLSKRWNEIITSPAFAKDHMRTQNSTNNILFTDTHLGTCHMVDIYETDEAEYGMTASRSCRLTKLQGGMPFRMSSKWQRTFRLCSSSCHGMLCIAYYHNDHAATIYVWNPFTHKSKKIPWPVRKIGYCLDFLGSYLGFGYDHVADHYKIVVHMPYYYDYTSGGPKPTTHIMSLKKAADIDDGGCGWRKIEKGCAWGHPIISHYGGAPVNVGGSMYWIGSAKTMPENNNNNASKYWMSEMKYDTWYSFILKFNLVDETSETVAPPAVENFRVPRWATQIGKFKGCLCFFQLQCMIPEVTAYDPEFPFSCNIWIKHEDKLGGGEAKAIWSKFMNVPDFVPFSGQNPLEYSVVAFSNKGDVILFPPSGYPWFWIYSQAEQRFRLVKLKDTERGQYQDESNIHLLDMETLVSPF